MRMYMLVLSIKSIDKKGPSETSDVHLGNVQACSIESLARHAETLADGFTDAGKDASIIIAGNAFDPVPANNVIPADEGEDGESPEN